MFLQVNLIHDVDTERVAQLIPTFCIGIVTGTHRIDIGLFHQQDILQHPFLTDHMTGIGIHLMTVDTTQTSGDTVDHEDAVFNSQLPEANLCTDGLDDLAVRITEHQR